MSHSHRPLPTWTLIVSWLFALLELVNGVSLFITPALLEMVDVTAKGVDAVIRMWAVRQFALGVILLVGALKKSRPVLNAGFLFMMVMFLGDLIVGVHHHYESMIVSGLVMCALCCVLFFFMNRQPNKQSEA